MVGLLLKYMCLRREFIYIKIGYTWIGRYAINVIFIELIIICYLYIHWSISGRRGEGLVSNIGSATWHKNLLKAMPFNFQSIPLNNFYVGSISDWSRCMRYFISNNSHRCRALIDAEISCWIMSSQLEIVNTSNTQPTDLYRYINWLIKSFAIRYSFEVPGSSSHTQSIYVFLYFNVPVPVFDEFS